jgi:puromycin-sensitive aminopeptidase
MEDTWAMTRAGKSSIGSFLGLAQALRSEQDLAAINLLAGHLTYVGDTLVPESQSEDYRRFVRKQFDAGAQELGWTGRPGDSDEQKAIRASLLGILGRAGDQEAIATARTVVQNYMRNPSSVEGTLVTPAFMTAAAQGDAALYAQINAALPKARSTEEYNTYLLSLAQFRDAALVGRTIALVDQGKVRQQDYPVLFSALLANPQTSGAAWTYLKAHWSDLAEKVTSFGGTGAVAALGNFCSAERRTDVEQFFQQHRAPGAERTVSQSLERIDNCIEFKTMQQQNMESWLTLHK